MSLPAIMLIAVATVLLILWGPSALRLAYYVLGPAVDNRLGMLTGRDLDAFKRYDMGGKPLGILIEERLATSIAGRRWAAWPDGRSAAWPRADGFRRGRSL